MAKKKQKRGVGYTEHLHFFYAIAQRRHKKSTNAICGSRWEFSRQKQLLKRLNEILFCLDKKSFAETKAFFILCVQLPFFVSFLPCTPPWQVIPSLPAALLLLPDKLRPAFATVKNMQAEKTVQDKGEVDPTDLL